MYLTPVKIKVAFRWGSDQFFPVSSKAWTFDEIPSPSPPNTPFFKSIYGVYIWIQGPRIIKEQFLERESSYVFILKYAEQELR